MAILRPFPIVASAAAIAAAAIAAMAFLPTREVLREPAHPQLTPPSAVQTTAFHHKAGALGQPADANVETAKVDGHSDPVVESATDVTIGEIVATLRYCAGNDHISCDYSLSGIRPSCVFADVYSVQEACRNAAVSVDTLVTAVADDTLFSRYLFALAEAVDGRWIRQGEQLILVPQSDRSAHERGIIAYRTIDASLLQQRAPALPVGCSLETWAEELAARVQLSVVFMPRIQSAGSHLPGRGRRLCAGDARSRPQHRLACRQWYVVHFGCGPDAEDASLQPMPSG